jgi:hypothetical protein
MKKTPVLVLGLVILLSLAVIAEAAVIKVKVQSANVRQKPDVTSTVLSRVSMGAMFEASKKVGNFYEISITDNSGNLVTGYISSDVVEEVGAGAAAPTAPAQTQPRAAVAAPAGPKPAGGLFIGAGLAMTNFGYDADTKKMFDDLGISLKMKMGFLAGVGYELPLSENLAIVPGLYFSTMGQKLSATFDNTTYTDSYSWSSLIIPVEVKLSFNGPFVQAGPYLGYVLSAKYVPQEGETTDMLKADSDGNTYVQRMHFGISIGAGFELNMSGMGLILKAGYQLGLSKLNKPYDSTDTSSIKHSAITVMAAIKL